MQYLKKGKELEMCRRWHDRHLASYFGQRDLDTALKTYDPNAVGVGTGLGEYATEPEAMRQVIERDLSSFPDPIDYRLRSRDFYALSDDVFVCQACLDLKLETEAHRMTLRNLRHTMTIRRDNQGELRICHIHVSFPTDIHGDEEAYPLKEIEEITDVVDELIASRTSDLTDAYRKLEKMAIQDRLTGVFNRIRIDEKLQQEIQRARRYGSSFALILLDIDHFKWVNDSFGHLIGDRVLRELASLLRSAVRETDLVGRWGGEEFLVILPETTAGDAAELANRIRADFADCRFETEAGREIPITVSCGIGEYEPGDTPERLFQRTDEALLAAKRAGRNRCRQA